MPRDKKAIHRATSDVEDSDVDVEDEDEDVPEGPSPVQNNQNQPPQDQDLNSLIEERKKYLKDIILKRNIALKAQREKDKQHKVSSTKN